MTNPTAASLGEEIIERVVEVHLGSRQEFDGLIRRLVALATPTEPMSQAARDMLAERQRQVSEEGWTPEHDDEHSAGELARAAACYAIAGTSDGRDVLDNGSTPSVQERLWPLSWSWECFKPAGRRRNLVKANALILAEVERMDRAASKAIAE